mgnify:CR=1 FL=1
MPVKFQKFKPTKKERLFAIGDIHGCLFHLNAILEHLATKANFTSHDRLIFLGDYIDRGPDSKGVIDRVIEFQKSYPKTIALRGNHEDMFMDYLGLPGMYGDSFLRNGGRDTLTSFGFDIGYGRVKAADLPSKYTDFLMSLVWGAITDEYVFVHAGVSPFRDLENQSRETVIWTRNFGFEDYEELGKIVVHGHTPNPAPLISRYEINIDTGCVFEDSLTAINLTEGIIYNRPWNRFESLKEFRVPVQVAPKGEAIADKEG